jgi:malyl-CoA/(S)-citramalyl-CoA lyase
VFSLVTASADSEAVALGAEGLIEGARADSVVIDMATISPLATRRIAQALAARGIEHIDAPVSGGPAGAQGATLSIMAGGKPHVFEQVKPLFACLGKTILHMGDHGAGQITKACNQLALTVTAQAAAEALSLARSCGLDPARVHEALMGGVAASRVLELFGKRMVSRDFGSGIDARLYHKDLGIVLELAQEAGLPLPGRRGRQAADQRADGRGRGHRRFLGAHTRARARGRANHRLSAGATRRIAARASRNYPPTLKTDIHAMSLTSFEPTTPRLHRSELAVPASNPKMIDKASRSAADVVFLDLEDSVAPDDKPRARRNVVAALNDIDWGHKTMSVRINGLDTQYTYRDVIEVVEACPRLDLLFLPKVGVPADVYALDVLVTQIEQECKREKRTGFEIMIETALGLCNVEAIAQSSRRLEAMCFGSGDFAASTAARSTTIGGLNPDYGVLSEPGADGKREYFQLDPWHAAHARIVTACRAYGLRPIDGPYSDFNDTDGFRVSSQRAAALGFEGRMVIHPAQIEAVNTVFSPAPDEVARARRIVDAMAQAARDGRGAVQLDGRMIDIANIRMAQRLLAKADAIAAAHG